MKTPRLLLLLPLLLAALAPTVRAQTPVEGAPSLIDYQGLALDSNGNPLAPATPTNYTMKFRLYSSQSGGASLWEESQTVTVSNGQFSVRLGQGIAIDPSKHADLKTLFNGKDRYLGLTIVVPPQAEAEITPRLAFLTSPFSFIAERAKTADAVLQSTGASTLGTTTITNFTLAGPGRVNGANVIEFGGGVAGKEIHAGKIGYGTFTPNTLDIVGAGTNGADRKIRLFAEGGLQVDGSAIFTGGINAASGAFSGAVSGASGAFTGNLKVGGANSQIAVNNGGYSNVMMTLQTRPSGDAFLIYGQNPLGTQLFSVENTGSIFGQGLTVGTVGSLNANGLRVNIGGNIAGVLQSSSTIGTWLALQNSSVGGRNWQFLSTGSGNGEGAGKLLMGYGDSPGSTAPMMTLVSTNRVGINNNNPLAPLHVSGSAINTSTLEAYLDINGAANVSGLVINLPYSIIADSRIRAGSGVDVVSDARIKNILGQSNGAADLHTLLGIQITDYTLKDRVGGDRESHKKVIAQQVEKVLPQAVKTSHGVVPDIYRRAVIAEGWVQLATDLQVGERVRLIAEKEEGIHEVLEIAEGRFRTAWQPAGERVFVFGREVDDFRSVDYDAIAMLNVSATQELQRKLGALEQRVVELEAKDKARDARLSALEKLLSPGAPAVRTVALPNAHSTR